MGRKTTRDCDKLSILLNRTCPHALVAKYLVIGAAICSEGLRTLRSIRPEAKLFQLAAMTTLAEATVALEAMLSAQSGERLWLMLGINVPLCRHHGTSVSSGLAIARNRLWPRSL